MCISWCLVYGLRLGRSEGVGDVSGGRSLADGQNDGLGAVGVGLHGSHWGGTGVDDNGASAVADVSLVTAENEESEMEDAGSKSVK